MYRDEKRMEFRNLVQGDKQTVAKYELRLAALAKYAPEVVVTQEDRCYRFEQGLRPEIERSLVVRIINFKTLVESAVQIEEVVIEDTKKREEKRKLTYIVGESSRLTKKGIGHSFSAGGGHLLHGGSSFRGNNRSTFGGPMGFNRGAIPRTCYNCGGTIDCPSQTMSFVGSAASGTRSQNSVGSSCRGTERGRGKGRGRGTGNRDSDHTVGGHMRRVGTQVVPICVISVIEARRLMLEGCEAYLAHVIDAEKVNPTLEEILEVFPDDLLGLPPHREVDFTIETLPRVAPISIAPYRIAPVELQELKKQLEEILKKGFVRPSSSLWGALVLFVKKKDETVGYFFYDPSEQKIFILRNAVFLGKGFPVDSRSDEVLLEESSEVPQQNVATSFEPLVPTNGVPILHRSTRESEHPRGSWKKDTLNDPGSILRKTYSLVAMAKSTRILLAIAAWYEYEIWQVEVKTAFLNGFVEEEIFINQLEGFTLVGEEQKCTRPDVAYALSLTSRYQACAREAHWSAVKIIVKYLKTTKDMFLIYGGGELILEDYSDASFQSDDDDAKSQSGCLFKLNGGVVAWKSSKQATTTDSTAEAQYIEASEADKEAVWMKNYIQELGLVLNIAEPVVIFCDNNGAIAQAKEPRSHHRS
ncbi:UNVERIFIED_CONTAM: Retrovirus-related Pol polyprotein from transposon TNT 1-94 [Sesamum radiatum]|uniref:Retrovirus-related Pol polyprotein from transposon TNT 1-94 n=1 Tax=Sesamum radiatum TaxID=300843 RepID=A0AAW2ME63_SESRA